MTTGHEHKFVDAKAHPLLTWVLMRRIYKTKSAMRASESKFVYRIGSDGRYELRVLGVLHGLFGWTLMLEGDEQQ